jgi:hypothetical protein
MRRRARTVNIAVRFSQDETRGEHNRETRMKLLEAALALIVFFCGGLGPLYLDSTKGK